MDKTNSALAVQLQATDRMLDDPSLSPTTRAYLNERAQAMRHQLNGQS